MTIEDLSILIKSDEHRQLELKKSTGELKDGMHTACAFLNTDGGWLIFGVTPQSLKIIGQQVTDNTQRELSQALCDLEPQVDVRVEYIDIPERDGYKVIAIHFNGWIWGKMPYTYRGCPYYKVESTTKIMPRDMYDERLRKCKPDFFAWERQFSDFTSINSLDEKLIRGVVRLGVERGRIPEIALTEPIIDILNKWKLINGTKLLNAATALFTKETGMYTQFTINMARFQGTDKNEFIDNQRSEGNIFVLLNDAMNFFRKHLNMNGKIVGLLRDEHLEIPAEALREAVLNSLCHRQYEKYNLPVSIAIYDDRIEIANPGIFPPQITPENINMPHHSYPYNPLIANVLYNTSYIENWGSGIKRIIDTCHNRDIEEPTWSTNDGFVVVAFRRPIAQTAWNFVKIAERLPKGCRKEIIDTLALIMENPSIRQHEIAERLSVSVRTAGTYVAVLKKYCIKRVGGNTNGHWEIK